MEAIDRVQSLLTKQNVKVKTKGRFQVEFQTNGKLFEVD